MYGWVWRHLPGPTPAKAAQALVLLLIVVAVLMLLVFPHVEGWIPGFNDVTVGG